VTRMTDAFTLRARQAPCRAHHATPHHHFHHSYATTLHTPPHLHLLQPHRHYHTFTALQAEGLALMARPGREGGRKTIKQLTTGTQSITHLASSIKQADNGGRLDACAFNLAFTPVSRRILTRAARASRAGACSMGMLCDSGQARRDLLPHTCLLPRLYPLPAAA